METSLRSMAVLLSRAQERHSREIRARSARERAAKPREKVKTSFRPNLLAVSLPSPAFILARPTKTAMLRRLSGNGNRNMVDPILAAIKGNCFCRTSHFSYAIPHPPPAEKSCRFDSRFHYIFPFPNPHRETKSKSTWRTLLVT